MQPTAQAVGRSEERSTKPRRGERRHSKRPPSSAHRGTSDVNLIRDIAQQCPTKNAKKPNCYDRIPKTTPSTPRHNYPDPLPPQTTKATLWPPYFQTLKPETLKPGTLLLLPPQHLHHPLIIIYRVILNHNLPLALAIANPHPHPQHPLQVHLRRPYIRIRIHPPRPSTFLRRLSWHPRDRL